MHLGRTLLEKLVESLRAVVPIGAIVLVLHFTISPMPLGTLMLMVAGMVLLIIGFTLFSIGTEIAMMPMGEHIGSALIRSKSMPVIIICLIVFGIAVTAAEPGLAVLANQVASIPNTQLIIGISVGVGIFLVLATLRILFRWPLGRLLIVMYIITFALAIFMSDYVAVAFDASAITTGPITVPFLLAIGAGFTSIMVGRGSDDDSFGICAVCSVGPILAVLILGMFYNANDTSYTQQTADSAGSFGELISIYWDGLVQTFFEVLVVLVPIVAIFIIFQIVKLKLSRTELVKIFVGLIYLLFGLTIFLAGANYGFMPAAIVLGETMGALDFNWVVIPVCLVVGVCVTLAEPAVHVLTKQVEEVTNGAISRGMMLFGMCLGVGIAMSLAMVRILFNVSIWWVLVPGYIIALALTLFVPKIFIGIGFDSGGIAAGAMSAAFVLPFTTGVCIAAGGNVVTDAFGVVGLIAMMPPIIIQIMGIIYKIKLKRTEQLEIEEEEKLIEEAEDGLSAEDSLSAEETLSIEK